MKKPGFAHSFLNDVAKIPLEIRDAVNRPGGLHEDILLNLLVEPRDHSIQAPSPAEDMYVKFYHDKFDHYSEIGTSAIHKKEVAYCILAGGAGTGVNCAKALLRIPELDMSLLTLKLFQAIGDGPVWIFTSPSLRKQVEDHVTNQTGIDHTRIHYIEQYESYRLTPDNRIISNDCIPELYPCGHGDLFPSLANSEVYTNFVNSGGKYVVVVNVDNVFASLDPAILGHHIESSAKVSCEVVRRKENEPGGVVVDGADGLQVAELFRIDDEDLSRYTWLNTNSYIFNCDIAIAALGNCWHRTKKDINGKLVVQYERLLQELTAAYDTTFIGVDRTERYMPIKTPEDLNVVRKIVDSNWRL
jgi:UTP--glucose-1-phosphate uridylyltransferase